MTRPTTRDLALIAVPVGAWAIQGLAGWYIGSRVCQSVTPLSARVLNLAIGAAAMLAALAAGAAGRRRHDGEMVGTASAFVALVFTLGIVWASLSNGFLDHCGVIR